MLWSGLLLAAVACSAAASTTSDAGTSEECQRVVEAAVQFRDYLKTQYNGTTKFRKGMRLAVHLLGVDLSDNQELEEILCPIVAAEPKTIPEIAQISKVWPDERQLALAYAHMVKSLKKILEMQDKELEKLREEIRLYDAIGFPNFPLNINSGDLLRMVSGVDDGILTHIVQLYPEPINPPLFNRYDFYEYGEEERRGPMTNLGIGGLAAALYSATSLEDFAKRVGFFHFNEAGEFDERAFDSDVSADQLLTIVKGLADRPQIARNMLNESLKVINTFNDELKKSGVLSVARGGRPLYTCDFLGDAAVEAMALLLEMDHNDTVRRFMARDLGLEFSPDNECAVRSFVCAIVSSGSKAELSKVIPEEMHNHPDVFRGSFDEMYEAIASFTREVLLRPGVYLERAMAYLRMTKAAERVNFPNFPLYLTRSQAKQFAALWDRTQYYYFVHSNIERMGMELFDADSDYDIAELHWSRRLVADVLEWTVGKTESILKLASCVYQLIMSAEEQGLLMLPDD